MKPETKTLTAIFGSMDLGSGRIDFLSVDVEGFNLDVPESSNWANFRPEVILIESLHTDLEHIQENPIVKFLHPLNYKLFAKKYKTLFFTNKPLKNN